MARMKAADLVSKCAKCRKRQTWFDKLCKADQRYVCDVAIESQEQNVPFLSIAKFIQSELNLTNKISVKMIAEKLKELTNG